MVDIATVPMMLRELKLATIAKHWEPIAQKALDEQWLPQAYLAILCQQELDERYQKRLQRYTREARLPPGKHISGFDFTAVTGIKMNQITALI